MWGITERRSVKVNHASPVSRIQVPCPFSLFHLSKLPYVYHLHHFSPIMPRGESNKLAFDFRVEENASRKKAISWENNLEKKKLELKVCITEGLSHGQTLKIGLSFCICIYPLQCIKTFFFISGCNISVKCADTYCLQKPENQPKAEPGPTGPLQVP